MLVHLGFCVFTKFPRTLFWRNSLYQAVNHPTKTGLLPGGNCSFIAFRLNEDENHPGSSAAI